VADPAPRPHLGPHGLLPKQEAADALGGLLVETAVLAPLAIEAAGLPG
jgi:hypothetical protein